MSPWPCASFSTFCVHVNETTDVPQWDEQWLRWPVGCYKHNDHHSVQRLDEAVSHLSLVPNGPDRGIGDALLFEGRYEQRDRPTTRRRRHRCAYHTAYTP